LVRRDQINDEYREGRTGIYQGRLKRKIIYDVDIPTRAERVGFDNNKTGNFV